MYKPAIDVEFELGALIDISNNEHISILASKVKGAGFAISKSLYEDSVLWSVPSVQDDRLGRLVETGLLKYHQSCLESKSGVVECVYFDMFRKSRTGNQHDRITKAKICLEFKMNRVPYLVLRHADE